MPENLGNILITVLKTQNEQSALLTSLCADVEVLTMTFYQFAPAFAPNLAKALAANRERYAEEIQRKQAELELLRADVSRIVH